MTGRIWHLAPAEDIERPYEYDVQAQFVRVVRNVRRRCGRES